jgi:nucleoid-associated protein YgaU
MSQESTGQLGGQKMPMPTSATQIDGAIPDASRAETGSSLTQKPVENLAKNPITRAVKEGDNLSQIANEAYGSSSRQYVEWVRQHNPQISDPNIILPGQKIVLPEYIKE